MHSSSSVYDDDVVLPTTMSVEWESAPPATFLCPCCDGTGEMPTDVPDYASFTMDRYTMHSMLMSMKFDDDSVRQAWTMMQQHGDQGVREVQSIVTNIIKNKQWIKNHSAFLASSCVKWMHH